MHYYIHADRSGQADIKKRKLKEDMKKVVKSLSPSAPGATLKEGLMLNGGVDKSAVEALIATL